MSLKGLDIKNNIKKVSAIETTDTSDSVIKNWLWHKTWSWSY